MEYHPSKAFHDKLRYAPCLRLDGISPGKMLDPAFWASSLALWVRPEGQPLSQLVLTYPPFSLLIGLCLFFTLSLCRAHTPMAPASEFSRVEVLYDALLPWLLDGPLVPTASQRPAAAQSAAAQSAAADGQWRSPARSGAAGAWKCALEALRWSLARSGHFPARDLKRLTAALREELLARAAQDLAVLQSLNARTAAAAFAPIGPDAAPPPAPLPWPLPALPACGGGAFSGPQAAQAVLLYFTRASCEPCKAFTPVLRAALEALGQAGGNGAAAVVVVPLARDADDLAQTLQACAPGWAHWSADPSALAAAYNVKGTPTLVVLDAREQPACLGPRAALPVLSLSAAASVSAGRPFPWAAPRALLTASQARLLGFASELYGLNAVKASEAGRTPDESLARAAAATDAIAAAVRALASDRADPGCGCGHGHGDGSQSPDGPDDAAAQGLEGFRPPALAAEARAPVSALPNGSLLVSGKAEGYAGAAREVSPPVLPDLALPLRAATTAECLRCLKLVTASVDALLRRCSDGHVTSQLALKLQAYALVEALFAAVLPAPLPLPGGLVLSLTAPPPGCPWRAVRSKAEQLEALRLVHGLMLSYAALSQCVASPSRASDSSRALAAAAMLAIVDALLRNTNLPQAPEPADPAAGAVAQAQAGAEAPAEGEGAEAKPVGWDEPSLALSELMREDGGFALDQGVCEDHRPFERVAAAMELVDPSHALKRSEVPAQTSTSFFIFFHFFLFFLFSACFSHVLFFLQTKKITVMSLKIICLLKTTDSYFASTL